MPNSAWPEPCRCGGKVSIMIDCEVDISAPPPMPWITRKITSSGSVREKPHRNDAAVKSRIEPTK